MWDSVAPFLSTASAIVAFAALAGIGLQRGRVTNAVAQLREAREQIEALRSERDDLKAKLTEVSADLAALGRVVRGEVHWQAITDQLDDHHRQVLAHWASEEEVLRDIRADLRDVLREQGRAQVRDGRGA